jgi:hypothetical protein
MFRVYPVGACETSVKLLNGTTYFWSMGSRGLKAFKVILLIRVRDEERSIAA